MAEEKEPRVERRDRKTQRRASESDRRDDGGRVVATKVPRRKNPDRRSEQD